MGTAPRPAAQRTQSSDSRKEHLSDIPGTLRRAYPLALARLCRINGNMEDAQDTLHEAVKRALEVWPQRGLPAQPHGWLVTAARNAWIDRLRYEHRRKRVAVEELDRLCPWSCELLAKWEPDDWGDDLLRLIVTCCDPALGLEERTLLTLHTVAGLSITEVASAFLSTPGAMEKRITRARQRLGARHQGYNVPERGALSDRIDAVLAVVYLLFNEGYWSATEVAPIRREMCTLGLGLAHSIHSVLPESGEAQGLLALLLLHTARMDARFDADGRPVTLELQDRSRWDGDGIFRAVSLLEDAQRLQRTGPYQLEAEIAAKHTTARTSEETPWAQISELYAALEQHRPSPVVRVNRAFAVARGHGPEAGLVLLKGLEAWPQIERYSYFYLVRGVLEAELGMKVVAREDLTRALSLARNTAEAEQIRARIAGIEPEGKMS